MKRYVLKYVDSNNKSNYLSAEYCLRFSYDINDAYFYHTIEKAQYDADRINKYNNINKLIVCTVQIKVYNENNKKQYI